MPEIEDIRIVLNFQGKDRIPADLVARIIVSVDEAVKALELSDFESMKKTVPGIPPDMLEAVDAGLRSVSFKGLYLERADTGSITLSSLVASAVGWLMLERLREVPGEAPLQQEIRQFLFSRAKTKLGRLAPLIRSRISADIATDSEGIDVEIAKTYEEGDDVLYLLVTFTKKYPGPSSR